MTSVATAVVRPSGRPRSVGLAVAGLMATTGAVLLLGDGNVALAYFPVAAAIIAYALWVTPLRVTALTIFAVGLVVEVPNERPADGLWQSPFYKVGAFLYDNLNNVVGVEALRFSGLDAIIGVMILLLIARSIRGRDRERPTPVANVLLLFLAVEFLAVVWLEMRGLLRGGDFRQSLWQVRPILWLPVLAGIFAFTLRGAEDFWHIGRTVVLAASVKTAMGLYVLFTVVRPRGIEAPYVTTHSDSVLFVAAIAVCIAVWAHRPTARNLCFYGAASLWIGTGIIVNNRRIAWVALIAASWVIIAVLRRGRVKRAIATMLFVLAPFVSVYLAIGSRSSSRIFAPAASIISVFTQKDASSGTRDIENYNLLMTLRTNPMLGTGLGHEYLEVSKAYDITGAFSQYRYIGHNSILWLWSVAGYAGFTAIWLTLVVTVFLARRSYALARTRVERVAAAWVLAVIAAFLVQAWGDMGMHGWVIVMLLSVTIGLTGKLAMGTGAWPASVRLVSRGRQPVVHDPRARRAGPEVVT